MKTKRLKNRSESWKGSMFNTEYVGTQKEELIY